jgi:hypothetical protein
VFCERLRRVLRAEDEVSRAKPEFSEGKPGTDAR